MANVSSNKSAGVGKSKTAYVSPKLTTYGNVSELTGGPSTSGNPDGRSGGAMNA